MKIKSLYFLTLYLATNISWSQLFTTYTTTDGLVNDNVSCVFANANDDIWFGTQNGVSNFDGTIWTNYQSVSYPGMANDNILSIFVDATNRIWIGTDFGTSFFDGTVWTTYTTADGLGNDKVQCINQDLSGNMWFGTISGLSKFDGTTWTTFGTGDGLPFGGVQSITIHTNGDIWIGSGLGGAAIYDGTSFTIITESDGLINNKIRNIAFDGDGNSWIGTAEGITLLNGSNSFITNYTTIFTLPAPDTLNPIEDIKIDDNGVVWAGIYVDYLVSEGGVCAYNGNTWFEFDITDGLAGPVVRSISIAPNNDVWVATSTGVTKISDHTLSTIESNFETIQAYPNPTNSIINIALSENSDGSPIEIYNTSMKKIVSIVPDSGQEILQIDLSNEPSGIYFLRVKDTMMKIVRI